jgi:hypothetical protein
LLPSAVCPTFNSRRSTLTYDAGFRYDAGLCNYDVFVEGRAGREHTAPKLMISLWLYAYRRGISSVREWRGLISNKGTDTTSPITPTTDANGTTHFTINNTALNGLHDLPGAPQDTIKTTINMDVTSGGQVGVEGGVRTAHPSLEIYSYNPSGQSTTILQMQEHNPSDLSKQNQQIPQVAPQ